jgi:hypothetical protein
LVPAPVPIQQYQIDRLKPLEIAASNRVGAVAWQKYIDYANELQRQKETPEKVEMVG